MHSLGSQLNPLEAEFEFKLAFSFLSEKLSVEWVLIFTKNHNTYLHKHLYIFVVCLNLESYLLSFRIMLALKTHDIQIFGLFSSFKVVKSKKT